MHEAGVIDCGSSVIGLEITEEPTSKLSGFSLGFMMYEVTRDLTIKVQGVINVFHAGSLINLPEKSAQLFIQQGKLVPVQEKPQVVVINESEYENYFQAAVGRINHHYQAGTIDYIRRKYPGRFQESLQIENRLNNFWDKDFQEFKKGVDDWREVELELIKLFKQDVN